MVSKMESSLIKEQTRMGVSLAVISELGMTLAPWRILMHY
jgi:hypothetical protein